MADIVHCLECGAQFESRRSLHTHVKAHAMTLGEYYVKNFPRFDLFTGEPIPFKTYDNYITTDFRNKKNMYKWLNSVSEIERSEYCKNSFIKHMEEGRDLKFAPNHLYLMTHPRLPKKEFFSEELLNELFKKYGLTNIFVKNIPECPNFEDIPHGLKVFEDTREQQPLKFKNIESISLKLDFGDYTASSDNYSYVYVDRKAENDFKGTMSQGFERFCRELDRVREFGAYLYIIVESDFRQIYMNNNLPFNKKVNLSYTWENMRKIISSYSDVCQFVFTGSRENSERIIPYLLVNGDSLKAVDVQYFMEKFKWLG